MAPFVSPLALTSVIPAKRGKRWWKIKGVRVLMCKKFPNVSYGQRTLIENISAVKRKCTAQPQREFNQESAQVLLLGLARGLY